MGLKIVELYIRFVPNLFISTLSYTKSLCGPVDGKSATRIHFGRGCSTFP